MCHWFEIREGPGNSDGVVSGSLASPTKPRGGRREERGNETISTVLSVKSMSQEADAKGKGEIYLFIEGKFVSEISSNGLPQNIPLINFHASPDTHILTVNFVASDDRVGTASQKVYWGE